MTTTPDQQIRDALSTDPILLASGFDHRAVLAGPPAQGRAIVVAWSGEWAASADAALGGIVVDVVGVDAATRAAVLDRVAVVLGALRGGAVRRVASGALDDGVAVLVGDPAPAGRPEPTATAP
ncbi:hypothetical protein [Pseudonocardia spirodelae]|uniref:Uncharacterized protein n=1 Tax=Pseudonocardia spirodelae TaxID=3133431 RepID=A0ABU8TDX9_9PSEU